MAERPSILPEWATDSTAPVIEPNAAKRRIGWKPDEAPPAQYFNWWQRLVHQWVSYLDTDAPRERATDAALRNWRRVHGEPNTTPDPLNGIRCLRRVVMQVAEASMHTWWALDSRSTLLFSVDDGEGWTQHPSIAPLTAVTGASGNSTLPPLVGASYDGSIYSLANPGASWVQHVTGNEERLMALAVRPDPSLVVAVGEAGTIIASPDLVSWNRTARSTRDYLYGMHYADGLFVACGQHGSLVTSRDGVQWTERRGGTNETLTNIAHGNGVWIITKANEPTVLVSEDSEVWSDAALPMRMGVGVTFDTTLGLFLVVGPDGVATSVDGQTYTRLPSFPREPLASFPTSLVAVESDGFGRIVVGTVRGSIWSSLAPAL